MISIHRDEAGENLARVIDLGDVRVVSMDVFSEGVPVPKDAEVLELAGRYRIYVASEEAPGGRIEIVVYDNGSKKQLINIKYIGKLSSEEALAYLKTFVERIRKSLISDI